MNLKKKKKKKKQWQTTNNFVLNYPSLTNSPNNYKIPETTKKEKKKKRLTRKPIKQRTNK